MVLFGQLPQSCSAHGLLTIVTVVHTRDGTAIFSSDLHTATWNPADLGARRSRVLRVQTFLDDQYFHQKKICPHSIVTYTLCRYFADVNHGSSPSSPRRSMIIACQASYRSITLTRMCKPHTVLHRTVHPSSTQFVSQASTHPACHDLALPPTYPAQP